MAYCINAMASWLLFLVCIVTFMQISHQMRPCTLKGQWKRCQCQRVTLKTGTVSCRNLKWSPAMPKIPSDFAELFRITALAVNQCNLRLLQADAFARQQIVSLDLSRNKISFVDIQAFRGLEQSLMQLKLTHNHLTTLPIKSIENLQRLQYLWLQGNRIEQIHPKQFQNTMLRNLRFLYLDQNSITNLGSKLFTGLRLDTLTISRNRISSIANDAFPPTLRFLKMGNNKLDVIPFKTLSTSGIANRIEHLDFSENNITNVLPVVQNLRFPRNVTLILRGNRIGILYSGAFWNFPNLKKLDLSFNRIRQIQPLSFDGVRSLEELDLSFNRIFTIDSNCFIKFDTSLKKVNFEDNILVKVPESLKFLHNLQHLNLKTNLISYIHPDIISPFRFTLNTLILNSNRLSRVPKAALENMPNLNYLDLAKNNLRRLGKIAFGALSPAGSSLYHLQLSGNNLRDLSEPEAFAYMNAVAYLDLSYNRLERIKPNVFYLLSGLEKLFLQNNRLTSLPIDAVQGLKNLRDIILDNNAISVLPSGQLAKVPNLHHISLANNRIAAIQNGTFSSGGQRLKRLSTIHLSGNRISFLARYSFSGLLNLHQINLANNWMTQIGPLTFHDLPNLDALDLSWNQIQNISKFAIMNVPMLQVLYLGRNELAGIPADAIVGSPRLEEIHLAHNRLESFRCDIMKITKNLHFIDLSHNRLMNVDQLSKLKNHVREIKLGHNRLQKLGVKSFAGFGSLTELDLSDNFIHEMSINTFRHSRNLKVLNLKGNRLKKIPNSVFSDQEMIEVLDLSHNHISEIAKGAFGSRNVRNLQLSSNSLTDVPYDALLTVSHSLQKLDISHNSIQVLKKEFWFNLKLLQHLNISDNKLKFLDSGIFQGLQMLRSLDLSGNVIGSDRWDDSGLSNLSYYLEHLNLARIGLASPPIIKNTRLTSLNLSGNMLTWLDKDSLKEIRRLMILDLSHNQIQSIMQNAFSFHPYLHHIDLSHNPLKYIHRKLFVPTKNLKSIYLHNLPLLESLSDQMFMSMPNLQTLHLYNLPRLKPDVGRPDFPSNIFPQLESLKELRVEFVNTTVLRDQFYHLNMQNLKHLHIQGRSIRYITPRALRGLRRFKVKLAITDTKISTLPNRLFQNFRFVNYLNLDISRNLIKTFNPFPLTGHQIPILSKRGLLLTDLLMEGNPLECDCKYQWLKFWFRSLRQGTMPDKYWSYIDKWSNTTCVEPGKFGGIRILKVLDSIMCSNGISEALTASTLFCISALILYSLLTPY